MMGVVPPPNAQPGLFELKGVDEMKGVASALPLKYESCAPSSSAECTLSESMVSMAFANFS
jgi:hypothetical protein